MQPPPWLMNMNINLACCIFKDKHVSSTNKRKRKKKYNKVYLFSAYFVIYYGPMCVCTTDHLSPQILLHVCRWIYLLHILAFLVTHPQTSNQLLLFLFFLQKNICIASSWFDKRTGDNLTSAVSKFSCKLLWTKCSLSRKLTSRSNSSSLQQPLQSESWLKCCSML